MMNFKILGKKAARQKNHDEKKQDGNLENIVSKPADENPDEKTGANENYLQKKKKFVNIKPELKNKIVRSAIIGGASISLFLGGIAFSQFTKINYAGLFKKKVPAIEQMADAAPAYESEPYERVSFAENERCVLSSGKIPILMYHKIGTIEDRFTVSPRHFKEHLQKLFDNNFQLISLEEYVNNDFSSLKPGKKPALITFDDADAGQFEYAKFNDKIIYDEFGNRIIDPDSAVGIMADFYDQHPDFGKKAAFFVDFADSSHNYQPPFLEEKEVKQKLEYLIKEGFEIGYHTFTHASAAKISLSRMKDEVEKSRIAFKQYLDNDFGQVKNYFAFPFGQKPGDQEVLDYINREYAATFGAWGGAADIYASRKENSPPRIEISTNLERDVTNRNDVMQMSSGASYNNNNYRR